MSSTWRELTAIVFALGPFLPFLKGSYIKWSSDSQNTCRIIQVGSMRKDLHVIALKIFQFCVDNGIELEIQWIPRTKLDRADFISRIIDVDDWQITTSFFECWIIFGGLIQQCSTLTLARLPGASEIPLLASKTTPRLARSGNWDFCWSNLSLI